MEPSRNRSSAGKISGRLIMATLFVSMLSGSGGDPVVSADDFFREIVSCESINYRKNWCRVDTQEGVRLFRRKSFSPCVRGRTWGFTQRGIWVSSGCRALFRIVGCEWCGRETRDRGREKTVFCGSNNFKQKLCRVDTSGVVRLSEQKSGAPCIRGRTWGTNRRGIWVDCGCRARFKIRKCRWC